MFSLLVRQCDIGKLYIFMVVSNNHYEPLLKSQLNVGQNVNQQTPARDNHNGKAPKLVELYLGKMSVRTTGSMYNKK